LRRVWRFPFLIFAWRTSSIALSTALMPPIIPVAYKYVATAVMLMEINHCASNLQLPGSLPLGEQDIRQSFIPRPELMGVGGRFDFDHYSFSFATRPGAMETKLRYITNIRHPYHSTKGGSPEMNAHLEGLTHAKSLIDTNGAYRMATNWLERLEVDVPKLNSERPLTITQTKWMNRSPIPIFEVTWANNGGRLSNGMPDPIPGVIVMVSGDTGELIHLRQEDLSFSKRPPALIKDLDKLLLIPDAEFLQYSSEQRSNLLARFAAVNYSHPTK
jgi:hypothetical protein